MRRILIIALLFTLSIGWSSAWAASAATISATATVDAKTKQVVIEGIISTGSGQQVTLLVTDANGNLEHVDQTTSGTEGRFAFQYGLGASDSATYRAVIGGSGVTDQARLTITYTKETDPTDPSDPVITPPTNGGSTGAGSPEVVKEEQLRQTDGEQVSIVVPSGKKELQLPLNAGDILGTNKLQVAIEGVVLTIEPAILKQLQMLTGNDNADVHITLKVNNLTDQATADFVKMDNSEGVTLKAAGKAVEFDLLLSTQQGDKKLSEFQKPIVVQLPYLDEGLDSNLLGVYYYNPTSKGWEYVGGKINPELKTISVALSHFSTYAVLSYEKSYTDVPAGNWAYDAVTRLSAKHVVTGVSESSFSPGTPITRAEFTALLTRALGLRASGSAGFEDVAPGKWYAEAIAAAYESGIVQGVSSTRFGPEERISREQMAAMLTRAFAKLKVEKPASATMMSFLDSAEISAWARASVEEAVKMGLMQGSNNSFLPKRTATRAEAAQAVYNFMVKADL